MKMKYAWGPPPKLLFDTGQRVFAVLIVCCLFALAAIYAWGAGAVVVKVEQMFPGRYFVEALLPAGTNCAWRNAIPDRPGLDQLVKVRFSHPGACQTQAQCMQVHGNAQVQVSTSRGFGKSPVFNCGVIFGGMLSDPDLDAPDG